jgi:ABC-type lipoprotein export system ATPase subunit
MLTDIASMKAQFSSLGEAKFRLSVMISAAFSTFEKVATSFGIDELYSVEEKSAWLEKIESLSVPPALSGMLDGLESLKMLERKSVDVDAVYTALAEYTTKISTIVTEVNGIIAERNAVIAAFKAKYTDRRTLEAEIAALTTAATTNTAAAAFLETGKLLAMRERDMAENKLKELTDAAKKSADKLAEHLASIIPASIIAKMKTIVGRFSLNLELEHVEPAPNTKSYTFSYSVKDRDGKEREFKDGLSEGERQIISLAFFFAINDSVADKNKKVLVLDDPITSLDAPNLKILAELIYEQKDVFGQVIVLTHHPLFFKYLSKEKNVAKFGVLRNDVKFGGSFVYLDHGFNLTEEVKKCNEEITLAAAAGTFHPEETALKYGQLLRLSVERFIKHELLMWDKERNFEHILDDLAPSKAKIGKLTNDDLTAVTNLYNFCNWSNTMHVDKEAPAALAELMTHIGKFVDIIDKARS